MTRQVTGEFTVDIRPRSASGDAIGSSSFHKLFQGGLAGSSDGEMLAVRGDVAGSAGYVAMERVTATLAHCKIKGSRSGSFALQHSGTMQQGSQSLSVTVVPDSGTGGLAGLTGTMAINATPSHTYVFDYTLPEA